MSDDKDKIKKKKTLSLKLGSKPLIAPKKNIESGKTVIVEKKRYKRSSQSDNQIKKHSLGQEKVSENKNTEDSVKKNNLKKSGVLLKPLSKDEQKRILKADSKNDKNKEIEKIRSNVVSKPSENNLEIKNEENINLDNRDLKRDSERKKAPVSDIDLPEKKKTHNTFGRKKIRERKVTIVTALSDIDERTRSLAAYKRAKQKTKKNQI